MARDRTTHDWSTINIAEAHARMRAPGQPFEIGFDEIEGVRTRIWAKAPPTLRALLEISRTHRAKTFLVYCGRRISFETYFRAVAHLARSLTEAGLKKGDRLAIAMSNRPEWAVTFMAAASIGAIVTPLNGWWTGSELAYGLRDSGARFLVADEPRLARILPYRPELGELAKILLAGDGAYTPGIDSLDRWIGPPSDWARLSQCELPDITLRPDDEVTIFYTSGTTGFPKGALGTHRNALSTVIAVGASGERLRVRGWTPPASPAERGVLLAVPLFHVTGCLSRFLPALLGGVKLVMMPKWDVDEAIRLIKAERITATGGVPTVALQLLDRVEALGEKLPSLQSLSFGGAPVSPDIVNRIIETLPGVVPGTGFGMTEASSMVTHHQGPEYEECPDSCGPAVPVCEIKIVDSEGNTLPAGEIGELWCNGPNIIKGYWNNPAETAKAFYRGWLRTGDLARMDSEGQCYLVGRIKDVVIRGGENIYCVEVENALSAFPGIKEAAVFGVGHPTLGEVPVAVLGVGTATIDLADLHDFLKTKLAPYKIPEHYVLQPGPLPRNAGGKVIKGDLKKLVS